MKMKRAHVMKMILMMVGFCLVVNPEAFGQTINNRDNMQIIHPAVAKKDDKIRVTVTDALAGHEGLTLSYTNLRFLRGWHDHCGWPSAGKKCLLADDTIRSCCSYDTCCSTSPSTSEWSYLWFGYPTWEFEVTGCGEATFLANYTGGSHEGPFYTATTRMKILGGIVPNFDYSPENICVGEDVSFTDTSCGGMQYRWDFGDGSAGSGKSATHVYSAEGAFMVTLTVSDSIASETYTRTVNVTGNCGVLAGVVLYAPDLSPLPGVSVQASGGAGSGADLSGGNGSYGIILPEGAYSATAIRSGFSPVTSPSFDIVKGETTYQNFALIPAPPDPIDKSSKHGRNPENVSDPVHPATGNYTHTKYLFGFPGKRIGFAFVVSYNSLDNDYDGPLGFGWTHPYNVFLTRDGDDVTVKWGDGHKEFFRYDGLSSAYSAVNCYTATKLADRSPAGYEATLQNGAKYQFDSTGRLVKIVDLNNNQITLTHSMQLDRITDTAGRHIDFSYAGGRISAITSPLKTGDTVAFQYDGGGNLTGITDPRGNPWQFTYDASHRIVSAIDAKGNTAITNTYDAEGRVIEQRDASNRSTTFGYTATAAGTQVKITPPSGNAVGHLYDASLNLIKVADGEGREAGFSHDNKGRVLSTTDKQATPVTFAWDTNSNLTSFTDRRGSTTQMTYNSLNRLTKLTGAAGNTREFGYDANGNITLLRDALGGQTTVTYNANGQPLTATDSRGGTWTFTYTADGLLASEKDPDGNLTTLSHDPAGRLVGITLPSGFGSWQRTYDENSNLTSLTDSSGQVTTFAYDANNNITSRTFVPAGATTWYHYDPSGRLEKVTDGLGGEVRYAYDADGNLVSVANPDGVTISYQYNKRNELTAVVHPNGQSSRYSYDSNGNLTTSKNPLDQAWNRVYDKEGLPVEIQDPLGGKITAVYDGTGFPRSITDELGRTVVPVADSERRPKASLLPDGSVINYDLDLNGNVIRATDGEGRIWQFAYDLLDRLTMLTDPNGRSESYEYNAVGRLTKKTLASGEVISYVYDAGGRITQTTLPGSTTISYGYNGAGYLSMVADPAGTTTMTYDTLGRRLSRTDPNGNTLQFSYTPGSRLASLTYPGGKTVLYSYDGAGRLWKITDWVGNVTVYQYDALSRVERIDLPNGTRVRYSYNARGHLAGLVHEKSDSTVIAGYAFTRNASGQIATVTRTEPNAGRLLDSQSSFTYDRANSLLKATTDSVLTTYAFDLKGNLVSKSTGGVTITFTYDGLNRLTLVSDGTNTTAYAYDAVGNRLTKDHNGAVTRYLREGGMVYCSLDGSGNIQSYNVYGGPLIYSLDAGGNIKVLHGDERGSVIAVTDGAQNVVQSYSYDPYGKVVAASGNASNEFRYLGTLGVLVDENGLYHMQARYYDPEVRRFITEDPLGIKAGLNVYAYGRGDPVNRMDPSGLQVDVGSMTPEELQALDTWFENGVELGLRDPGYLTSSDYYARGGKVTVKNGQVVNADWVYRPPVVNGIEVTEEMQEAYLKAKYPSLAQQQTLIQKDFQVAMPNVETYDEWVARMHFGESKYGYKVTAPASEAAPSLTERALSIGKGVLTKVGENPVVRGVVKYGTRVVENPTVRKIVGYGAEVVGGTLEYADPILLADMYLRAGPVYDSTDGKWKSWDQWQIDHWRPYFTDIVHDPNVEASKAVRDWCKQNGFNYNDALNKKPGTW
jgi:RHS repeat-associated protein